MAYDKQLEDKFRRFQKRILDLEKAAEAQDRALRQIAEKAGVEIELTRAATVEDVEREEYLKKYERGSEDKDVLELLEESQRSDAD